MAIIEVPDIGVKKGNQIYSMRDMVVKAQGALKSFGDGCGVKKGDNIYVIRSGSLAGYDNVCQLKFVNDYIDGEIDSSIFSTFEGEFNDVKLHGNKILLSHNGGFVEYNAETKQVTKQFRPTGVHPTVSNPSSNSITQFAWFNVNENFEVDYFYYYYGRNSSGWRNYTFNKYNTSDNSTTIIFDNNDSGGNTAAGMHDICSYMVPFIAREGDFVLWSQNAESGWYVSESGLNPAETEATQNLSKFGTTSIDIRQFAGWGDFMDYAWKIDISDHIFVVTNRHQYDHPTGEVDSTGNEITVSIENRLSYFVTKNKTQHSTDRKNYNKYSYVMTHPNLQKPRAIMIEREDPTPRFIVVNEDGYAGLVDNQGRLIKRLLAFPEPIKMAGYDKETNRLAGLTKTKCYYTTLVI